MGSLSMFLNLPMPVKAAIFVVTGGGIMGLMFLLSSMGLFGNALSYLLLVAMAVAAIVFGIYKFLSKKMSKRKAKPFEQKMAESTSATPTGVSDPNSRAKLDDLRKRFEEGISVFKEHGKDLYTMPWYVIVGEPGSGKTEAMRHSNVGFPPGLQDQLQGVGGTVNMHWWFTNQAVMIDTAGRLMFDDIEPGNVNEWGEFLKMLRTARPNCPLNGMLLVIPADSLIKDSANDLERKGGKIAQQLDNIQRALGVRFPVYIVISKADRINGFREFFEELTDPVMQMQMMGWTNPNDLDTPFDPSMVEQHLKSVRERLIRRRFTLLADPVNSDDPLGHRIDQVDALYAFPDSLVKLSPRLRRYLEMVFVAGEWSQKPLFLRGIYFTSSMREGDALDADLADVLGVQVDALREGKLWERDRSYFLKDVFMEKVFREKGLVTRESNVGKSRRRQSAILLGAGTLVAIGAGLWTYFAYTRLEKSIEEPRRAWEPISRWAKEDLDNPGNRKNNPALALVQPFSGKYLGAGTGTGPDDLTRLKVQQTAYDYAQRSAAGELKTDPIFWFAAATTGSAFKKMEDAQKVLFDQYVLHSFVDEARNRIGNPISKQFANNGEIDTAIGLKRGAQWWSPAAVRALASLLEIEGIGTDSTKALTVADYRRWMESFSMYPDLGVGSEVRRFRRADDDLSSGWSADFPSSDDLSFIADVLYKRFGESGEGFTKVIGVGSESSIEAITNGVESFMLSWQAGGGEETALLGLLKSFSEAGSAYRTAEAQVLQFPDFRTATTSTDFENARTKWIDLVETLRVREGALRDVLNTMVEADASKPGETTRLGDVLGSTATGPLARQAQLLATSEVNEVFGLLTRAISGGLKAEDKGSAGELAKLRAKLVDKQSEYVKQVESDVEVAISALEGTDGGVGLIADLARLDPGTQKPRFALRMEAVEKTVTKIQELQPETADVFGFASAVDELASNVKSTRRSLPQAESDSLLGQAGTACREALDVYEAYFRSQWVLATLDELAGSRLASLVELRSLDLAPEKKGQDFDLSAFPWLKVEDGTLDHSFDEVVAIDVLATIQRLGELVNGVGRQLDHTEAQDAWTSVESAMTSYRASFTQYWMVEVPRKYRPASSVGGQGAWAAAFEALTSMDESTVFKELQAVSERSYQAIGGLDGNGENSAMALYRAALVQDRAGFQVGGGGEGVGRANASRMRNFWRDLTGSFADAWRTFQGDLRKDDEEIKQRYFSACDSYDRTPARQYWSGVAAIMLTAMESSLGNEASSKRDALWSVGSKFPLARDGASVMSVDEYARAKDLIAWLGSSVSTGNTTRAVTVSGLPERVSRVLKSIQSGEALDRAQRDLLARLSPIISWIDGINNKGGLSIRLAVLAEEQAFVERYKFVRVMRGNTPVEISGRAGEREQGTYRTDRPLDNVLLTLEVPVNGSDVDFLFWDTQETYVAGEAPRARGRLVMPWHGLQAVWNGRFLDGEWLMPLSMESGSGTYSVRIGGLGAPPESWPAVADWK